MKIALVQIITKTGVNHRRFTEEDFSLESFNSMDEFIEAVETQAAFEYLAPDVEKIEVVKTDNQLK